MGRERLRAQDFRIFCARRAMRSDLIGSDLDLRSDLDESRSWIWIYDCARLAPGARLGVILYPNLRAPIV